MLEKMENDARDQQGLRGTDAQSKDNYRHLVPRAKSEYQKMRKWKCGVSQARVRQVLIIASS